MNSLGPHVIIETMTGERAACRKKDSKLDQEVAQFETNKIENFDQTKSPKVKKRVKDRAWRVRKKECDLERTQSRNRKYSRDGIGEELSYDELQEIEGEVVRKQEIERIELVKIRLIKFEMQKKQIELLMLQGIEEEKEKQYKIERRSQMLIVLRELQKCVELKRKEENAYKICLEGAQIELVFQKYVPRNQYDHTFEDEDYLDDRIDDFASDYDEKYFIKV